MRRQPLLLDRHELLGFTALLDFVPQFSRAQLQLALQTLKIDCEDATSDRKNHDHDNDSNQHRPIERRFVINALGIVNNLGCGHRRKVQPADRRHQ